MTHHVKSTISRALRPAGGRRSDAEFDRRIEHLFGDVAPSGDSPAGDSYPSPAADLRASLVPLGTAVVLSAALVAGIAVSSPGT